MKYSNDYKIIVEQKYYAVFTDGQGVEQKVEVTKEVADTIMNSQRKEEASGRNNRRNTISLNSLDYEGEVFATYDHYDFEAEEKKTTRADKVRIVLSKMKPKQAELLKKVYFEKKTQEDIATEEGISQAAVSQRYKTATKSFEKIFIELFGKTL